MVEAFNTLLVLTGPFHGYLNANDAMNGAIDGEEGSEPQCASRHNVVTLDKRCRPN